MLMVMMMMVVSDGGDDDDLLNKILFRDSTRLTFRLTRGSCLSKTSLSGISLPSRLPFLSRISRMSSLYVSLVLLLLLFMSKIKLGSGVEDLEYCLLPGLPGLTLYVKVSLSLMVNNSSLLPTFRPQLLMPFLFCAGVL